MSLSPSNINIAVLIDIREIDGIAASTTIAVINYVILGFQFDIDGYYMHSFEIWLATTTVFLALGTLSFTLLEYRLGERDLLKALWINIKWLPFL